MRTKNGKRIGPVPTTLVVVFALAAMLSAGLLLMPSGAPAVQAQDGTTPADASPNIAADAKACAVDASAATNLYFGAACTTSKDTLDVVFENTSGDDLQVLVYVTGGTEIRNVQAMGVSNAMLGKKGLNEELFMVPKQSGTVVPVKGKKTVTVSSSMKDNMGRVYLFAYRATAEGLPISRNATAWPASTPPTFAIRLQFLGAPSYGVDGPDRNTIVEDFQQCVTARADGTFSPSTNDPDGNRGTCTSNIAGESTDTNDLPESRSKVISSTAEITGSVDSANDAVAVMKTIIDGKSKNHTLSGGQTSATVYAVVKDAEKNALIGTPVTFTVTSEPDTIARSVRTESAKAVASGDASEGITGIEEGDAIAMRTVSGLPAKGPYKVTVVVSAGDETDPLTLGTIVIQRGGALQSLSANACTALKAGTEDADTMDGCMKGYDPKTRYGTDAANRQVVIHTAATDKLGITVGDATTMVKPATAMYWWDSLNCVEMNDAVMPTGSEPAVGADDASSPYCKMYAGLSDGAKTAVDRAFSEKYLDVKKALDITDTGKTTNAQGVTGFTVKDDAPGGHYLLFVEAVTGSGDSMVKKTALVSISVAGELASYMVDGPAYIALNRSAIFTVSTMDKNGLTPIFDMDGDDRDDRVTVLVQPNTALVTGLNTMGQLELKSETGKGTFTVYAPLDAMQGQRGRIIIGSGNMQKIHSFTLGEATQMPGMELTAPSGIDVSRLLNTISVVWSPNSAQNATLIKVVLFDEEVTRIVAIKSYNPAASDPGAHDFENVPPGSYNVVVASYRSGEPHVLSAFHPVTVP